MSTDLELLRALKPFNGDIPAEYVELEARMMQRERSGEEEETWLWPVPVLEAAVAVLGPSLYNRKGQMFKALDRRIQHAHRVWQDKYGPLTPEQAQYEEKILVNCFSSAEATQGDSPIQAVVQSRLSQALHHERVHAGFVRRAASTVDVSDQLRDLFTDAA